jgi:hypothetical protein
MNESQRIWKQASCPNRVTAPYLHESAQEAHEKHRIVGVPAEIRTEHLSNTCLELNMCDITSLGNSIVSLQCVLRRGWAKNGYSGAYTV